MGLKIGKHTIKYPIVQGGMGVGISWSGLAGNVSKEGGLGILSTVGTGYYKNKQFSKKLIDNRPVDSRNFYSKDAFNQMVKDARKICGDAPLGANILYAMSDYGETVKDACSAGVDMIITGAGLPTNMPEFTKDYPDVALIPIVSSAKALKIICKRWQGRYDKLPDAVILEGPLSGGHQGFKFEDCLKDENRLELLLEPVLEEAKKWGDIPVIVAGGIWDKNDIDKFTQMGASGVQMGTRFIATEECDASDNFKEILLNSTEDTIKLLKSPVGYPARGILTKLQENIKNNTARPIKCISNCVFPCKRGIEAKAVGFCIADSLSDAYLGDTENGLFFSGANGYKVNEIITVKKLMNKLIDGE